MNDTIAAAENFYKEVEGVKLNVPCALYNGKIPTIVSSVLEKFGIKTIFQEK